MYRFLKLAIFSNRILSITATSLLLATYVSSYFAVVRFTKDFSDPITASFSGFAGDAYRPVYWMIDETPLRQLLLSVSSGWGVEAEVRYASRKRRFVKEMFK